ncbi:aldehyde dehydrogenase [Octadecabacter arcticus 238]|uniref:Aldehyde dehydrogenase n=1 Tax=Octadecabacter arcticus 238 TaxID=391616 RepID=M9RP25_9RHOB|nr:aldehyde dehydrogenase family protein [Octadecabacter arcticus]AGI74369.1 aldehyde dehydrogenase [Octadecabacter arcticus 238]
MDQRQFYINGAWIDASIVNDFGVIDPSTEEVSATISIGSTEDADRAVAAARTAFDEWSQAAVEARLAPLEKLHEFYLSHRADFARAMSQEMGAPVDFAAADQFEAGACHLEETIRAAKDFAFEQKRGKDRLLYQAIGVAALITPWNWPMNQVILKVAPALAAGCTVVLKPSELAPLSSMLLAELIDEAGFPAGVFNLVNGDGAGVGAHLSAHNDVDMVSFTGSTRAGILISKAAAETIKRVSLELGGKGANIVFEDASADAISDGVLGCFGNAGQSCDAPTRMLVQRSIYDQAVKTAAQVAQDQKVGSGHEAGDHMGPLISKDHWVKVQGLIETGIGEGARLVAGGLGRPDGLAKGYFAKPTVFADVNNQMEIARQEVFGPVLVMIPFDTEEEAIAIANDTPYGLGNYIQTQDSARADRVARRLRSGMVTINGDYLGADMPFGGFKQSGSGREGSVWGLEDFLEVKAVSGNTWLRLIR